MICHEAENKAGGTRSNCATKAYDECVRVSDMTDTYVRLWEQMHCSADGCTVECPVRGVSSSYVPSLSEPPNISSVSLQA